MPVVLNFLKKAIVKTVGGHLIKAHVESPESGAEHTMENLLSGYGWRFALGFFVALMATDPEIPNFYILKPEHEEMHRSGILSKLHLRHPESEKEVPPEYEQAHFRDLITDLPIQSIF